IRFFNEFDLALVKRFYLIKNNDSQAVRGWKGHRVEQRWFFAVNGEFSISYVHIDNWVAPSKSLPIKEFILRSGSNEILNVMPGYATCIRALSAESELLVFSDYGIEHAAEDSYDFDVEYFQKNRCSLVI